MTDNNTTQIPIVQISLPGAGKSTSYQLTSDILARFAFDLSEAEFIGNGNNLEIIVEGGGKVILEDYLLLAESNSLPTFEMLDGEIVAGNVYMFAFDGGDQTTEQDLETAADAGASGSGAGAYNDDPGTLFDGLEALGGQGDAYDSHSFATDEFANLDLPGDALIPPVAVDDVNVIVEDGWNRSEGENGHYDQEQSLYGIVEGNLLLNDYDDDNIDYPETSGSLTELSINTIDFPGEDYTGNDPDAAVVSDSGTQVNGLYGTLTIYSDGSYQYELDQNLADPLREGQQVVEEFTYTAIDPQGNVSNTATLTITVGGTNDAPEAFNDTPEQEVVEQGTLEAGIATVTGNVLHNDSDVDNIGYEDLDPAYADLVPTDPDGLIELGVTSIYSYNTSQYDSSPDSGVLTVDGAYGTLTINTDGSYEYTLDQTKADPLNIGDDPVETFSYSMWDGEKYGYAMLTIPVNGSNDAPVADLDVNSFTEAVNENTAHAVSGNVLDNDTDVDNTDLDLGITGINYSGDGTPPVRTSTLYIADHIVEGEFGTLYLNDDGSYIFVEDKNATDPLNSDDAPVADVFTYEVSDNETGGALADTATLTITITGANDSPVATVDANSFTEAVDDAAMADVSGNVLVNDTDIDNTSLELSITDIDYTGAGIPPVRVSDTYTADHVIEGEYGTLYLNNDGSYHYVEDKNATDPLNITDDPVTDVFTYEVSDNQTGGALTTTATLTITIDPANDSPVAVHDGAHELFITHSTETVIDDWSGASGQSVINGAGYTATAQAFDHLGNPVHGVEFTTWGNNQHLGVDSGDKHDNQKVDNSNTHEQITFEFDQPQSSFSAEFIAHGNDHVNVWVYPVGGGAPAHYNNVGNSVHITPGFAFDTLVFIPDDAFGMESLTTFSGGDSLTGLAEGNVLANDFDVDNVDFDDAAAASDMGLLQLSVADIDSANIPDNIPDTGTDINGDYFTVDGEFGSLKIYETGQWSYEPFEESDGDGGWQNLDHSGADVFEYTVSDGSGGTDTASLEISLNVNSGHILGGTSPLMGTDGYDVLFPTDGDEVYSGSGADSIVIDPVFLGSESGTVDIHDFSDADRLTLGNMEGANVTITSDTNDVHMVFSDIDGSDNITVNLLGVTPVHDTVDQTVEITTSEDLNALIQSIIDSGNNAII